MSRVVRTAKILYSACTMMSLIYPHHPIHIPIGQRLKLGGPGSKKILPFFYSPTKWSYFPLNGLTYLITLSVPGQISFPHPGGN